MSLVVPDIQELEVIDTFLTPALTMRLYSNNATPDHASTASSFTEISGGGYTGKALTFANWTITAGAPTQAIYNSAQTFTFTGATDAPGTIYGYYVTRNSDGKLMWAERFPSAVVPFSPVAGSIIRLLPTITVESEF